MAWNPGLYLRHAAPRLRPALDLLSQTVQIMNSPPEDIQSVLDLGCGSGNITSYLHKTFPNSRILGIDSSESMIAHARELHQHHANISFEISSIQDFANKTRTEEEKYDVVYSNAALHWIPNNEDIMKLIIKNAVSSTRSGGVLAIQMPDTKDQMSHLLMETAALRCGFMDLTRHVRIPRVMLSDTQYFNILTPLCKEVNIWSTEYVQQLKYSGSVKQLQHPVLEYTKATGLSPMLEAIGGEQSADGKKFLAEYERLLYETYPTTSTHPLYTHGESIVLFPFRRMFIICRV